MINVASCLTIGKAHGLGAATFPKCRVGLGYCLTLGPLIWECPHPRALPYTYKLELSAQGVAYKLLVSVPITIKWKTKMETDDCFSLSLSPNSQRQQHVAQARMKCCSNRAHKQKGDCLLRKPILFFVPEGIRNRTSVIVLVFVVATRQPLLDRWEEEEETTTTVVEVVMIMTQRLEWRRRLSRMYCQTGRNQLFFRGNNTTEGRKEEEAVTRRRFRTLLLQQFGFVVEQVATFCFAGERSNLVVEIWSVCRSCRSSHLLVFIIVTIWQSAAAEGYSWRLRCCSRCTQGQEEEEDYYYARVQGGWSVGGSRASRNSAHRRLVEDPTREFSRLLIRWTPISCTRLTNFFNPTR